jgi:hypothetical protein
MTRKCKHEVKSAIMNTGVGRHYNAHLNSRDARTLGQLAEGTLSSLTLMCDGFDIVIRRGHAGAITFELNEK